MSIPCDLHLHSSFSSDSDTPMEAMVLQAAAQNIQTVCFTEHMDLDYPVGPDGLTFAADLQACLQEVERLRSRYGDNIEILYGAELGMQPHLVPRYEELAASLPFDFLIASQHLVDGKDPYEKVFWEGRDETAVYREYFEELYGNLQLMTVSEGNLFDTAAHLDYVVRYGPNQNRDYSYTAFADVIDPILQLIIRTDKCLEVNTAGLKYGLGHTNPAEDVLKRYYDLGGRRITFGSDSHETKHIAWEFEKAAAMLLSIGFRSASIFRQRREYEIPLQDFCR